MPDIELKENYRGGKAGDCGHIDSDNGDNTVNVKLTRRICDPLPNDILVVFVPKRLLQPCHCDE